MYEAVNLDFGLSLVVRRWSHHFANDASRWRSDRFCNAQIYLPITPVLSVIEVPTAAQKCLSMFSANETYLGGRLWRTLNLWSDTLGEDHQQGSGRLIAQGKTKPPMKSCFNCGRKKT